MSRSFWADRALGARPEPLSPYSFLSFALQTSTKQSLPRPLQVGSTRGRVTAMAMAASTALPPRFMVSMPTWEARGTQEQAMPLRAKTTFRREA